MQRITQAVGKTTKKVPSICLNKSHNSRISTSNFSKLHSKKPLPTYYKDKFLVLINQHNISKDQNLSDFEKGILIL
jgi:hypothetical protein